jgi:hypothetical protein
MTGILSKLVDSDASATIEVAKSSGGKEYVS